MARRKIITVFIALIAIGASGAYSYLPDYLTKKMARQLSKIYDKNIVSKEIEVSDDLALNHQLFELYRGDSLEGYSIISRGLGCKVGGCDKPDKKTESFEQFFYFTAFDKNKNITKVRVLEYVSDHGYQIANKGWLKQFEKSTPFEVGKNIDAISGATISVNSITKGINQQVQIVANRF